MDALLELRDDPLKPESDRELFDGSPRDRGLDEELERLQADERVALGPVLGPLIGARIRAIQAEGEDPILEAEVARNAQRRVREGPTDVLGVGKSVRVDRVLAHDLAVVHALEMLVGEDDADVEVERDGRGDADEPGGVHPLAVQVVATRHEGPAQGQGAGAALGDVERAGARGFAAQGRSDERGDARKAGRDLQHEMTH
jgi:hypothetical protein